MADDLFDRFRRDRDRRSYDRFVEHRRSLVWSVCRRFLRDPHDVEDVAQEVFLKLSQHGEAIAGSATAWLTSTAFSTSVDFIRRSARERNRREALSHMSAPDLRRGLLYDAIRGRLSEALLSLALPVRELLVARFFRGESLRVIAQRSGLSIATMSRRVDKALDELSAALRDMGVRDAQREDVARQLDPEADQESDSLRFAPDWRQASSLWSPDARPMIRGWTRPMRIGVLFSYSTVQTFSRWAHRYGIIAEQVRTATMLPPVGIDLIGLIEPGTVHLGMVERTLREYGLTGGLIEADDSDGLATLDVILVGNNRRLDAPLAKSICDAVKSAGVGLLNEYWTAGEFPELDDPHVREMMLAASPWYAYHTPGRCGAMKPATVLREHPLLPGLRAGTRIEVKGCAPAYHVRRDAQVLIAQEHTIAPSEHRMSGLGTLPMPSYVLGELGRGSVAVINIWSHGRLLKYLTISAGEYFINLLSWLAKPRREVE
jgi:RNA polymerase sigma-70 factor (ECF subfamily)